MTLRLPSNLLKGLILRQEGEDRGEEKNDLDCSTVNEEHSGDISSQRGRLICYGTGHVIMSW